MAFAEEDRPAMKQNDSLRFLRRRLAGLRRHRQRLRWSTAASGLALAVLWALTGIFALDWCFQRNVDFLQRILLEGVAAAAVLWAVVRFVRPWLGQREDDTEMALLVERQAGIDSDLVAALQFESPDAANWGSPQLERAVIGRVAVEQKNLDVTTALPRKPLMRRLKWLVAIVGLWALLVLVAPGYVRVFFERLAFGTEHYPTRTTLVSISVNGQTIDLPASDKLTVHVACDQPVHFEVATAGSQPSAGRVEIYAQAGGPAALVPLDLAAGGESEAPQGVYRGTFARLSQPASCQIFVGDAWTDPLSLSVTPLPVVEIEVEIVPPDYARRTADATQKRPRGMREFSVLAGSEVRLTLDCDRPVKSAEVTIAGKTYPMKRADSVSGREAWTLATAGTPLAAVAADVRYAIQIHDLEGQTLEHPLEGSISIEADLPPVIAAKTRSPIVLATGSPNIHYEAADDHALSGIWLTWEAIAGDIPSAEGGPAGKPDHPAGAASPPAEKREGRIEVCGFKPGEAPLTREGDFPLALQSLPLKPGDTLKVTFHASDYRGPAAAATTDADPPLVFQVTDLAGFEASMFESDQKSESALEDIRKKHSGLGETQ
jgi:hypothetical protein